MICGNNDIWGREKHPLRLLYGYNVAADLQPRWHDEVVRVPGGAGELVTAPVEPGPAPCRAAASAVSYLVNVATDPEVVYPRSATGV
jgi:acetolactate synthase-1/2/3 large subunit